MRIIIAVKIINVGRANSQLENKKSKASVQVFTVKLKARPKSGCKDY